MCENGNVIGNAGAVGRGETQSPGLQDVNASVSLPLTLGGRALWLCAADVHPGRSGPTPPVGVGAEDVNRAALPEDLRTRSARRRRPVPQNRASRTDRPHRSRAVDDLRRVGRHGGPVGRRTARGAATRRRASTRSRPSDIEPPGSQPLPPVRVGAEDVNRAVLPEDLRARSASRR